ncbi:hypothetical protein [Peterkaempfera griseoplana]|uniref:hypothetical protein n=1 Tax=Peterkaempfera griseoplana TaxID=66896 RepID=UPI0006E335AF|nr:hypothetical protein [Peterkaempfera griseoplana]
MSGDEHHGTPPIADQPDRAGEDQPGRPGPGRGQDRPDRKPAGAAGAAPEPAPEPASSGSPKPATQKPTEPAGRPQPPSPAYLRLVRGAPPATARPANGSRSDGVHDLDGAGDDLDAAERELRAMLQRAVGGLQPSPGALQRIQHAVPQRRTRRRQAWGGAAAVLLLAAAAVPALRTAVGTDTADHVSATRPVASLGAADRAPTLQGGDGTAPRPDVSAPGAVASTLTAAGPGPGPDTRTTAAGTVDGPPRSRPGSGPTGSAPATESAQAAPECRVDQLGAGAVQVEPADAAGKVYGSFSVVNSSALACTVEGAGTVQVSSAVGTDASRFPVLLHTAGDPASALPRSNGPDTLVLRPGAAYLVRFGWVPDSTNSTACVTTPSSSPSATASPESSATGSSSQEITIKSAATDGPGSPGSSVSLSHTPAVGAPSVGPATIPGACAGTVYRTGPLPAG